jgi:hypothetical protein
MRNRKKMAKRYVARKSTQALDSASWMAKTQVKVILTALATAFAHKLIHKAAEKYPKLSFLETKDFNSFKESKAS